MRMLILIILMMTTIPMCIAQTEPYKAVVVVPVADLVGSPLDILSASYTNAQEAYARIPLCGGNHNRWHACSRNEQLLFNEIVEVLETKNEEVKIRVSRVFYITQASSFKQTDYWTLKKNIVPLHKLTACGIDERMLPMPIDFNMRTLPNRAIIALSQSFYDADLNLSFSAGTRFVCAKPPSKKSHIQVFAYNKNNNRMQKIAIPKSIAIFYDRPRTNQDMRTLFVSLARQWAHLPHGFIPYVWGGSSIVYPYTGTFHEHTIPNNNNPTSFFEYPTIHHSPHTGMDCSGLVARAAQLAGIPYYYKNTYTLSTLMQPLERGHHLQIGDLIWTPGHVMIVSDIDNNLLIEARSYFQGYGKIHEISLHKVFKNINTYKQLEDCFFNKKSIERIDIQGIVRNILPHFLLLNLDSIFK